MRMQEVIFLFADGSQPEHSGWLFLCARWMRDNRRGSAGVFVQKGHFLVRENAALAPGIEKFERAFGDIAPAMKQGKLQDHGHAPILVRRQLRSPARVHAAPHVGFQPERDVGDVAARSRARIDADL